MVTPKDNKRDEVLRRMLKTPPTPHKPVGKTAKVPTPENLKRLANDIGQNDPNDPTKKSHQG